MKKSILASALLTSFFAVNAQQKPNIIWLMAEDISTDLECYGMKAVKTPNLNKMAEEGVRFDNCFVTNSISSPSRSSMLTGVHQLKINAHHHRSNTNVPLDSDYKPFTSYLRDAGYTCVLGNHGVMGFGRKVDANFKYEAIGEWDGKTKFGLFDKYDRFEQKDQPFFAQIQLLVTHRGDWWNNVRAKSAHPVNPDLVELPPYMADNPTVRLDWAKYLDQIEYMDNEVAMIFKELEEKGMAQNTIVIFIGDNGRCNLKGKGYLFDPGLRIPFIVYSPYKLPGKKIRKDVVSAIDITATILDFAGVSVPKNMDGKPVFDKNFKRDEVYAARDLWDEIMEKSRAITSGEWKYIRNDMPEVPYDAHQAYLEFYRPAVHVMRTLNEEGKLNEVQEQFFAPNKPKEELYNLKKDPFETNNLASNPKYAKILKMMRTKTVCYDKDNVAKSNVYHPETAGSVEVFEWVKAERPELYKQMQEGVEIGFKKMTNEYKKSKNIKSNKDNE